MRTKVVRQAVGALIVFLALAWLIASKKFSFDWESSLTLRVVTLGALTLALALWGRKSSDSLRGIIQNQSFKRVFWVATASLIIYFFIWPWAGEKWNEVLAASASGQTTQAARSSTHADIERREVATESRPVRVIPRGPFDRYLVGPVERVSYKLTYPSGDSTITLVHIKGTGHFEMPVQAKWLEFRPFDTDSVTFVVKQHEQR
jgi:hypothetical protein